MDSGHGIGGIAPQAHETAPGAARHWDPLAGLREQDGPPLDVLMCGTVFYDLIFTGMDRLPGPGEEIWTQGMGSCPGGIANLAVAFAFNLSTDVWVNFKLFGGMGLMFVFAMAQVLMLSKYVEEKK